MVLTSLHGSEAQQPYPIWIIETSSLLHGSSLVCVGRLHLSLYLSTSQLFLERERAAILAEAKTDDLISEAPKPALDKSGEWKETSGEIQWVAAETKDNQPEKNEDEKKEEEDEELDLNKGRCLCAWKLFLTLAEIII